MKNTISIMLTLQIPAASLSATAHAAFVSHIDHEVGHPHVHHDSEVNSKVTEGGVESDAYDATNHTHLSLDILIAPHSYAIGPIKDSWVVEANTTYVNETQPRPVTPPSI